ncbi:P-loop containing nucleoside triphosphate hydrolase protein [Fusarium venenatum]|uniref:P-loop containing nucleoside triphosphate hydrolase protein n=1 Tax=Fusarium venenatum TaxID=56646 RepID=UPI001DC5A641|nr:P-loop containing nucleoside triphosphate hydrolase protein [Fusarium venenatum]
MSLRRYSRSHGAPALPNFEDLQQPYTPNPNIVQAESSSSGKIVVLNGFPGTGKFTILKQLQKHLPGGGPTCLLDNHLLIDPVAAVILDRSDRHHELRRLVRAPIFAELGKRAKDGDTILMTACLAADNQRDDDFLHEHLEIARNSGVPIYWINLRCDPDILEQRLSTPDRQKGSKSKLTDVSVLRDIIKSNQLIKLPGKENNDPWAIYRELDVSGSVESSVGRLKGILGQAS